MRIISNVGIALLICLIMTTTLAQMTAGTLGRLPCVCGKKSVLLVLTDFLEYRHISSQSEISHLFFGQVGRYVANVSFDKLSLQGNTTNWITLPRPYEQYIQGGQIDLLGIATDSFSIAASRST